MRKIDKKDLKILRALDVNSRASYSELEKGTFIPAETVRYRMNRLITDGVIQNFLPVIDGGLIGYYYYKVFFKLHNVDEQKVQEIIEHLASDPTICWVVRVDEVYDIAFTPRVTNPVEQSALMDRLRQRYSRFILDWILSVNIAMDFLTRDYLTKSKRQASTKGSYTAQKEKIHIDKTSNQIIEALSRDARASAAEIAESLPVSSDAVLDRIRDLEKKKVVVRYTYVLNNAALGQVNYYVLVYLNELSAKREEEFQDFCRAQPNIVYLIKSLGTWDYELSVEAANVETYRELMMEMNRQFSDIISRSTGMMVRKIHKYVYP